MEAADWTSLEEVQLIIEEGEQWQRGRELCPDLGIARGTIPRAEEEKCIFYLSCFPSQSPELFTD